MPFCEREHTWIENPCFNKQHAPESLRDVPYVCQFCPALGRRCEMCFGSGMAAGSGECENCDGEGVVEAEL